MASTKDRQRAMERARYERVQAKMQQKRRQARRKQRIAIVSSIATIAVIGGIVAGVLATSGSPSPDKSKAAAATGSAAPSATSSAGTNPLAYEASGTSAVKGITMPTYDAAAATKQYTATIHTNVGDIVFTADGKDAPYTVYSFVYLAEKNYFDNSKCHRLTTSTIFVLQCGDPTGTGRGTPGYTIPDENLASLGQPNASGQVIYKAGSVAMANTGAPHSGGSQFFLVYKDSPLGPSYTPFGTITKGLDILQQVAAKGSNNSNGPGDGAPNEAVTIEKVSIS